MPVVGLGVEKILPISGDWIRRENKTALPTVLYATGSVVPHFDDEHTQGFYSSPFLALMFV